MGFCSHFATPSRKLLVAFHLTDGLCCMPILTMVVISPFFFSSFFSPSPKVRMVGVRLSGRFRPRIVRQ